MNVVQARFRRRLFPLLVLGMAFFAFLFHLSRPTSAAAPPAQETATPSPDAVSPSPQSQTVSDPEPGEWAPVNLSRSGAAANASMVVDSGGVAHVVWQEEGDDTFYYARGEDNQWSYPAPLEFPFGTRAYDPDLFEDDPTPLYQPQFVAVDGRIVAFWSDDEGTAFFSSVPETDFATFASWTVPQPIVDGVLKLSVVEGEGGVLHMSYIRDAETAESPAGIYYTRSDSSGTVWSEPVSLYSSRYFRALPAEEAHVQVAADGAGGVFVVWDNRPIDQVFFAGSDDGGENWGEVQLVDSHLPDDSPEAAGPSHIQVSANGEGVHLAWTAGHTSPLCTVYHQWSDDGGASWEEQQQVLAETTTCPERPRLVWGLDNALFLLAKVDAGARLVAWQEGRWSEPQLVSSLGSFFNPANNRRVEFQWQHVVFLDEDEPLAVGLDAEQPGDIWALLGSVGTITDWFPPPSPWQTPVALTNSAAEPDEIVLVSDSQGSLHAFWSQPASNDLQAEVIQYARWRDMEWSRPAPVLRSPSGSSTDPSATAGPSGRLYAVWAAAPGQLYFSQALATEASVAREWSEPFLLPSEHEAARSPVIAIDEEGTLYVAYAVALNESRGIYLVVSEDQGETWEAPVRVFDAVAAGWAMVDRPRLIAGGDGVLHLTWTRHSLPPQSEPQALLYARSSSGGERWSEPEVVDEGATLWSQIAGGQADILHQVWQKQDRNRFEFWYRFSLDGGLSWSRAETVGLGTVGAGAPDLAVGPGGRVHLFHLTEGAMLHWWWEDEGWTEAEPLNLGAPVEEAAGSYEPLAAAAIAADGSIAVLYPRPASVEGQADTVQYRLLASERTALSPVETQLASASPTVEPTLTATVTPTVAPEPMASPTTDFPLAGQENEAGPVGNADSSPLNQLLIGLLPVVLILIVVTAVALRRSRFGQR